MLHYSDLRIRYDVSGMGDSGVAAVQFSFSVPAAEYGSDSMPFFPGGAVVELDCSDIRIDPPKFYIISRSYRGDNIDFLCYDKSYTVDRDILLSEDKFDADGYIDMYVLLSHIAERCGFAGLGDDSGLLGEIITKAHKDNVYGQKIRTVLDDLSAACMGFWVVQGDKGTDKGVLTLITLGGESYGSWSYDNGRHEKVFLGSVRRFPGVIVTDGSRKYLAGASVQGCVEIDTPYASEALAWALYGRLKDFVYQSWECRKMVADSYFVPSAEITLGDYTDLYVNHCDMQLTSTGVYASVGRNAVTENETAYLNRTTREMLRRYRIGDIMGSTMMSRNGLCYVFRDEVNNKTERYGFSVNSGGVTAYDGAMLDGVMPDSIESVSENRKKIRYGDSVYVLSFDKASDGTKSNIKFEREGSA